MEFTGRVILDLPEEGGTSRAGNAWRKKSWVAETNLDSQYPKKVKMDAMNSGIDSLHIEVGKWYTFSVDVESREFNGRWYSDVRVWRAVEVQDGGAAPASPQSQPASNPFAAAAPAVNAEPFGAPSDPFGGAAGASAFGDATDDLPF